MCIYIGIFYTLLDLLFLHSFFSVHAITSIKRSSEANFQFCKILVCKNDNFKSSAGNNLVEGNNL